MARLPLVYVVRYRPGPSYRSDRPLLQQDLLEHERYMRAQTQAGVVLAAGPTFDPIGGIVLVKAADRATAELVVLNDPAAVAGIFAGEVTDWRPMFDANAMFQRHPPPIR